MDQHNHEAYEVHDAANVGDVRQLQNFIEGLRQDLGTAEGRIYDLERELADLRSEVRSGN